MTKFEYHLSGKIIPERVTFSTNVPPIRIAVPEYDFDFMIALSIVLSHISIKIESENEITDYETLRNVTVEYVRMHTDSYGYLNGYTYGVEITSFSGSNNKPHVLFGVGIHALKNDDRPFHQIGDILPLLWEHDELRIVLGDLRRSIEYPNDTALFCYRAIEGIMQFFVDGDPQDDRVRKNAWKSMRDALNISESWIKERIEKFSIPSRHGKRVFLSGKMREDMMNDAWKVTDRFISYLKNDKKSLDRDNFPELKL